MATWLKYHTAVTVQAGPFLDSGDGVSPEIALDIPEASCLLSKNGGAFAAKTDATHGVHDAAHNGWYTIPLAQDDADTVGSLVLEITMAGALPVWREFMVLPAQVYDSLVLGTDLLDVNDEQLLGTAYHAPALAGVPYVDVHNWGGAAAPAMTGDAYAIASTAASVATTTSAGVSTVSSVATTISAGVSAVASTLTVVSTCVTATSGGVSTVNSILTTTSAGVSTVASVATTTSAGVSTVASTLTVVSTCVTATSAGVSTNTSILTNTSTGVSAVNSIVALNQTIVKATSQGVSTVASIVTGTSAGVSTVASIATSTSAGVSTVSSQVAGLSAGSGLTAQETRDAMKLAPSAGAAADGSVDAHLDLMATLSDLATAADLADAVWDEVLSGHSTAGFAGQVATATSTGVSTVNSIVTTVSTGVSTVNSIATKTSAGVSTNTSIVTAVSSYIATNLAAVYGATERACINLLDDTPSGLADIQADVVHTMDDVEVALDSLSTISTAVSTVTSIVTAISTTLTSSVVAVSITSALAGAVLTIRRGDSLSATWTGLASNAGHAKIWLTIKRSQGDADSASIVQIEHAAGLLYLNGAVAATAANGTLTADSNTQITVTLTATETEDLVPANGLYYDLQMLVGTTTTTLTEGPCNIVGDVTRAVA
jgi:hypothetical protein